MRKVNILLMAGRGNRFKVNGFKNPKPFININGKHMFVNVILNAFKPDLWIIISLKKHSEKFNIGSILKKNKIRNFKLIELSNVPNGQAKSALKAKKYLNNDDIITIFPCDGISYFKFLDIKKYLKKNHIIVITRKPEIYNLNTPKQFGWVTSNKNLINQIYCKSKPKNIANSSVIVGIFVFRNKKIMISSFEKMLKNKAKINNEYYIDESLKSSIILNYKLYNYQIDKFISTGTPDELKLNSEKYKWN